MMYLQRVMQVYLKNVVLLLLYATSCNGLGINCRGSGVCPLATFENEGDVSVLQGLRDAIYLATFPDDTTYNSGDHVICVSVTLQISIGIGKIVSLSITGDIGTGGICVFPQNLAAPITLGEIKPLADALLEHGCTTCGSVPVHFVDQGSNDPSSGILTWNYVSDPICIDNCISEADEITASGGTEGGQPASSAVQVSTVVVTQTETVSPAQTSMSESETVPASSTESASTVVPATTTEPASSSEPASTSEPAATMEQSSTMEQSQATVTVYATSPMSTNSPVTVTVTPTANAKNDASGRTSLVHSVVDFVYLFCAQYFLPLVL